MKGRYLEVTFRKGKPLAAYLYLPRSSEVKSVRTEEAAPGLRVDFGHDDQPIGLEITAPGLVTVDAVNQALDRLGLPSLAPSELAPLEAA